MKIKFLGTGAAEGWPAAFCQCEYCKKAWELGGKNIRKRTCTMVDDKLLIDIGPDLLSHVHKHKLDLSLLSGILITHSHDDHIYPNNISCMQEPLAHCDTKIPIYGNAHVMAKVIPKIKEGSNLSFTLVHAFEVISVGGYTIHPLLANHSTEDEEAIVYAIEKDGKVFFNGNDTGYMPKETWDYLENLSLDLVSLDTTMGGFDMSLVTWTSHMNVEQVGEVRLEMIEKGIAHSSTPFVMNHFSHNGYLLHHELEERGQKIGFQVAYDGFEVEI